MEKTDEGFAEMLFVEKKTSGSNKEEDLVVSNFFYQDVHFRQNMLQLKFFMRLAPTSNFEKISTCMEFK